jgi:hypothetical protein
MKRPGVLMYLVVETPQPNLIAGMKWFLGTYTSRFNRRHRLSGHLFGGRYKALVIDSATLGYLKTDCDYVHLNPARARVLRAEEPLRGYVWSSLPDFLQRRARRPPWLRVDRLLGEHGIPKDSPAGRRQFAERLVREELARWKWAEKDLAEKPKTDRQKASLARRLRRETTMTMAWIARRLQMGCVNTLKNTLRLTNSRG